MRKTIQDAGLRCESCHYQFRELKENLDERIAFAKELGLKQMVLSTFGCPRMPRMADYKQAADELNQIGGRSRRRPECSSAFTTTTSSSRRSTAC